MDHGGAFQHSDYQNDSGITVARDGIVPQMLNMDGTFEFPGKSALNIPADSTGDGVRLSCFSSIKGDFTLLHSVPDPSGPA